MGAALMALLAKMGIGGATAAAGGGAGKAVLSDMVNLPGAGEGAKGLITGGGGSKPVGIPEPVPIIQLLQTQQPQITGRRGRIDRPGMLSELLRRGNQRR